MTTELITRREARVLNELVALLRPTALTERVSRTAVTQIVVENAVRQHKIAAVELDVLFKHGGTDAEIKRAQQRLNGRRVDLNSALKKHADEIAAAFSLSTAVRAMDRAHVCV